MEVKKVETNKCDYDYDSDYEYGCTTPKHDGCRIPVSKVPPPPPKKRRYYYGKKKAVDPPKNGYFDPPDLELVFRPISHAKEACA